MLSGTETNNECGYNIHVCHMASGGEDLNLGQRARFFLILRPRYIQYHQTS